jgi:quercetin dioxygenase-like cupin family protein
VAHRGQSIYNTVTKEHITFVRTTEDTNGQILEFVCTVPTDGIPLQPHVHETQEERFQVLRGTLGVMLDGERFELQPGDRAVLPAGMTHQWWNAGEDEVSFRVEAEPARNLEAVLEANAGMAQAGKLTRKAMPRNPFLLANLGKLGETYLPGIPIGLQKLGLQMGSMTGRMLGIDPGFGKYRALAAGTAPVAAPAATPAAVEVLDRAA